MTFQPLSRPNRPLMQPTGAAHGRVLAVLATTAIAVAGCASSGGAAAPSATGAASRAATSPTARTPTASTTRPSTPKPTGSPASTGAGRSGPAATAAARMHVAATIRAHPAGGISIAGRDLDTGASYSAGASSGMWMASVYKLFVLETLLLEHQHSGGLSDYEESASVPMIEQSDNVAGYELWEDAGGNAGLASTARRLQMAHTVPGRSDPTFTTSSGPDCLQLLAALVAAHGALNEESREFALHLMRNVDDDERWGAGAAADPDTSVAIKNGWLGIDDANGPGENDDGRWAVNSLGIVTSHGHRLLLAILTRHDADFDSGKALVAELATWTATIVTG